MEKRSIFTPEHKVKIVLDVFLAAQNIGATKVVYHSDSIPNKTNSVTYV